MKDHVKCDGCGAQTPALTCFIGKTGLLCNTCAEVERAGYDPTFRPTKPCIPCTPRVQPTGFNCSCCNSRNDYAEANQPNGSYLCYECR